MQNLLVALIVALAALIVIRRLLRLWRPTGTQGCGCDCAGCSAGTCDFPRRPPPAGPGPETDA